MWTCKGCWVQFQRGFQGGSLEPTFVTSALCLWHVMWIFPETPSYSPLHLFPLLPLKFAFQNGDLALLYPHCHACRTLPPPECPCFISPEAVPTIHTWLWPFVIHLHSWEHWLWRVPLLCFLLCPQEQEPCWAYNRHTVNSRVKSPRPKSGLSKNIKQELRGAFWCLVRRSPSPARSASSVSSACMEIAGTWGWLCLTKCSVRRFNAQWSAKN